MVCGFGSSAKQCSSFAFTCSVNRIAGYFNCGDSSLEGWQKIVIGAILTTIVWIVATYFTPPDDDETLRNFVKKVNPGGPGWSKYSNGISSEPWPVPKGILSMVLGCTAVYGFLLGVGQLIYGETGSGLLIVGFGMIASIGLFKEIVPAFLHRHLSIQGLCFWVSFSVE